MPPAAHCLMLLALYPLIALPAWQALADTQAALAEVEGSSSSNGAGPSSSAAKGSKAAAAAAAAEDPGPALAAEILAALADDLNTPLAVAGMSSPLKAMNDLLHTKKVRMSWASRLRDEQSGDTGWAVA